MSRSFMAAFSEFAIKTAGYKKKVANPVRREKYIEKLRKNNEKPFNKPPYLYKSKPEKHIERGVELFYFNKGKEKKIIYAYTIDSSNNTEYIKTTAGNTALIKMYFTLRAGADMKRTYEEFSLVEDSSGRWKIAGWKTVDSQSWD